MTFKNIKTKKSTSKKYRCYVKEAVKPVDETTKISTVKQDTFTEFTVTMSKGLEKAAASDFTMVRDNDNQVITVKSAKLDDTDKTKVKLVVYTSLTDAKTYTVTYTADDEAKTQSSAKVTVTDGVVADVAITPLEITANKETLIQYQTLDANGVIISQKNAANTANNVDVKWDSLHGTMNEATSKYILYNVGDTAKFTVTYHTYKYDTTTGAETGVITKDFTITAVQDASVVSQYVYTAATRKPYDWSKITPKQTIALGDDGTNSDQRTAYFLIKNSKGENVTEDCGYTVESSDNSIVVADGNVKDGALLNPVAKGSAYLMIKDTNGNVVNTMPITVGDRRTISTFKLSASSVSVVSSAAFSNSNATTTAAVCAYTDIDAKDQYGDKISVDIMTDYKRDGTDVAKLTLIDSNKTIRVEGATTNAKGSGTYIIQATDKLGKSMTTSLRVNSIEPTSGITYSVVFVKTASDADNTKVIPTLDTTLSEAGSNSKQELTAVIVEMRNNVVVKAVDTANIWSLQMKKNDGTVIASASSEGSVKLATSAAVDVTDSVMANKVTGGGMDADALKITAVSEAAISGGKNLTKNLGVGTYTLVFELRGMGGAAATKTDRAAASFTVVDNQAPVTARVTETNCGDESTLSSVLVAEKYVEYYYGDVKISPASVEYVTSKVTNNSGRNAYVTDVTVKVPVANSTDTMTVKVPVSKTFITTAAGGWS